MMSPSCAPIISTDRDPKGVHRYCFRLHRKFLIDLQSIKLMGAALECSKVHQKAQVVPAATPHLGRSQHFIFRHSGTKTAGVPCAHDWRVAGYTQ